MDGATELDKALAHLEAGLPVRPGMHRAAGLGGQAPG